MSIPVPKKVRSDWYVSAMERLVDVIQDLSHVRDLNAIMKIVRRAARELVNADGATFVLRDGDKCFYAEEDAISPLWKGQHFPMTSCVSGWSMIHSKPVVIPDIYRDARIPADAYRPTFVKSMVMVPVRRTEPVGAIGAYWAKLREPTDEEVIVLQSLANSVSIAMENVDLYSRLQTEMQEVERTIFESTIDGIMTVNDKGIVIRYNKGCEKILGYSKNEIIGHDIRLFLPPMQLKEFETLVAQYKAFGLSRKPVNISGFEIEGIRKNGTVFEAELSLSEVVIGAERYFSLVIRDVTERKLAQEMIRVSEERYELAVKGSNDGLWDWDVVNNELYWSPRFKEMLGISKSDFQPTYNEFKDRLHPDDYQRIVTKLEAHTRNRIPYDEEFRMRRESGEYIWVRARGASVWNKSGMATRMCGSVTDITNHKKAEHELQMAREEAERASEAKSTFLANMSHELRTPLNSIIGLSRMLSEDSALESEQREMAHISHVSAENLLEIVNDILDLSKVEAGELVLENIPFSLQEVLQNVMQLLLPQSSQKGITLSSHIPDSGMPYFVGDPLRLGRVLINLVSNAIKYTDEGSVSVDVSWRQVSIGKAEIHVDVRDTGMGIPQDKLDSVFDKFVQADSSITRRYGGTGLGLSISREIVLRMGGEIGVDSHPGKGSRFWFWIPVPVADENHKRPRRSLNRPEIVRLPPEKRVAAGDLRILVAEDHLLNQALLKKLLPRIGIEGFAMVGNGAAALDELQKNPYDMILMDCHMPLMSGYDATKKIRSEGNRIPIIAMTADAMIGTRERCLTSGMDDYLEKPLNPDDFRLVLSRWITFADEDIAGGGQGIVDLNMLKEFSDNHDDLKKYIAVFLSQAEEDMTTLRHEANLDAVISWTRAAHRLKGGAGMMGARKLQAVCEEAQVMVSTTAGERRDMIHRIESSYAEVRKALELISSKSL